MKNFIILVTAIALSLIIIPSAMSKKPKTEKPKIPDKPETNQTTKLQPNDNDIETISVFRTTNKKSVEISIHEYVCGSVASEMPLAYEEEALKAQAVACYTNALRLKKINNGKAKSDITDDSKTHQGYIDENQRREKWGEDFYFYEEKLQRAVSAVENKALYYNNELCVASFFAISSGKTENSENIWGSKIPYLKSVDSSGDKLSPKCLTKAKFKKQEALYCLKKLNLNPKSIKSMKGLIKIVKKSEIGTVLEAEILGKKFSGEEIRRAFSLRSPVFTIKETADTVTFNVSGYGHGVGLSQYGADYLARQGYNYNEILQHYYTGAVIK